jgi:hypothetical protein
MLINNQTKLSEYQMNNATPTIKPKTIHIFSLGAPGERVSWHFAPDGHPQTVKFLIPAGYTVAFDSDQDCDRLVNFRDEFVDLTHHVVSNRPQIVDRLGVLDVVLTPV